MAVELLLLHSSLRNAVPIPPVVRGATRIPLSPDTHTHTHTPLIPALVTSTCVVLGGQQRVVDGGAFDKVGHRRRRRTPSAVGRWMNVARSERSRTF
mmetsp:Transcript_29284/g.71405  ORF Transcript_29284/g.71405 Transcript_29284/m.71405 type:complete len:97 (+) Transcript_29284:444-734(+)